jgi:hypothetical protein
MPPCICCCCSSTGASAIQRCSCRNCSIVIDLQNRFGMVSAFDCFRGWDRVAAFFFAIMLETPLEGYVERTCLPCPATTQPQTICLRKRLLTDQVPSQLPNNLSCRTIGATIDWCGFNAFRCCWVHAERVEGSYILGIRFRRTHVHSSKAEHHMQAHSSLSTLQLLLSHNWQLDQARTMNSINR